MSLGTRLKYSAQHNPRCFNTCTFMFTGYVSWVDPVYGSTFIQCLCHVLKDVWSRRRLRDTDILKIATNTNQLISRVVTEGRKSAMAPARGLNALHPIMRGESLFQSRPACMAWVIKLSYQCQETSPKHW